MAAPSLSATGSIYLVKFSRLCMARPPEMMILAEVSSGRSDFDNSSPTNAESPGSAAGCGILHAGRAALARRLEGRGAHGDDLLGVGRLHGLDRVAGIDRPLESVGRDHLGDLGNLHDVEQRGHARHHVLAVGGRRRDDGVIAAGERDDQRGERLGDGDARKGRRPPAAPSSRRRAWRRRRRPLCNPCRRPARARRRRCALAAVSALVVASLSTLLSCSAIRSVVIRAPPLRL